jgi:hypothetical protein
MRLKTSVAVVAAGVWRISVLEVEKLVEADDLVVTFG